MEEDQSYSILIFQFSFNIPYDEELPEIEDSELEEKLKNIDQGNLDALYKEGIYPTGNVNKNKRLLTMSFIVLKNNGAIEQFISGLGNVDRTSTLKENSDKMKRFLMPVHYQLTLEHFLHNINVLKNGEEGPNAHRISENLACDLEIFFAAVANGEMNGISLEDILYLFTSLRKIPPFGLHKLVDIFFCDTSTAPKISICGYTVNLLIKRWGQTLTYAIKFGGGFGQV